MPLKKFNVRVQAVVYQTADIKSYELVEPQGAALPEFSAGAHIDVHLQNGLIRQFSLCGSSLDRHVYKIGVLKEKSGTGGSEFMHENVHVGQMLEISEPKQMFKLNAQAERHLLIAGGIGVTPILSMLHTLEREQSDYVFHYCTRAAENTAFLSDIEALVKHGEVHMHFDGGNPAEGLDLRATLKRHAEGTHLYCCGPVGMMEAVKSASDHWPSGTVHFEYFSETSPSGDDDQQILADREFQIQLSSTGEMMTVPADMSIVEVLRANGVFVDTSCEEGYCGTCLTRYLSGEPEHRDEVLDEEDHEDYVLICCARSYSDVLVLDL